MFSFFELIYEKPVVEKAFKQVCLNKMLSDGYFDMSSFIYARIKKEDMLATLITQKSIYAVLYENPYPTKENLAAAWDKRIDKNTGPSDVQANTAELSENEAEAIVNWVYRAFNNADEREQLTKEIFKNIKDFHEMEHSIVFARGVVYNKEKVDVHFITSIVQVHALIASFKLGKQQLFYRGHTNPNYMLLPSVLRSRRWKKNECAMYNELLIQCPGDFEKCHTHLEKLVQMQHYGLPTRLLDITRNPLVALYFACERGFDGFGELVLLAADRKDIKYPQSDTVSILASLPLFDYTKQMALYGFVNDPSLDKTMFNEKAARLLHEIRLEKPAFKAEIDKEDLLHSVIVYALKNNNRIVKQDGAFILCGLLNELNMNLNKFRYKEKGKTVILLIDKKKKILEQLDAFSINRASLFPEIECVTEYIKEQF